MLLVDTAATGEILAALENPAICGFTTNPKLIAAASGKAALSVRAYRDFCESLCRFAGGDRRIRHVMIQTIATGAHTRDLAMACREELIHAGATPEIPTLWIKLPPTLQDLRGIEALRREGCKSLVTAVFTPAQALLAMESGADGIAVYFGRLKNHCVDWERQLTIIVEIMREKNGLLLLASLSEPGLLTQSLAFSRDVTAPPALVETLMDSPLSKSAMKEFASRVETYSGESGFTAAD